jgi:hypothetical protein
MQVTQIMKACAGFTGRPDEVREPPRYSLRMKRLSVGMREHEVVVAGSHAHPQTFGGLAALVISEGTNQHRVASDQTPTTFHLGFAEGQTGCRPPFAYA